MALKETELLKLRQFQAKDDKQKAFNAKLKTNLEYLKREFSGFHNEVNLKLKNTH